MNRKLYDYIKKRESKPEGQSAIQGINTQDGNLNEFLFDDNYPCSLHANEAAAEEAQRFEKMMKLKEFDESFLGKYYRKIKDFQSFVDLGLNPSDPSMEPIARAFAEMQKFASASDKCLLVPYLIEKEKKGIIEDNERRILDQERTRFEDYSMWVMYFSKSILCQISNGVFGNTMTETEIFKNFNACHSAMIELALEKNAAKRNEEFSGRPR